MREFNSDNSLTHLPTPEELRVQQLIERGWLPVELNVDQIEQADEVYKMLREDVHEIAAPVTQLLHTAAYLRRCKTPPPPTKRTELRTKKFMGISYSASETTLDYTHRDREDWPTEHDGFKVNRELDFIHDSKTDEISLNVANLRYLDIGATSYLDIYLEYLPENQLQKILLRWDNRSKKANQLLTSQPALYNFADEYLYSKQEDAYDRDPNEKFSINININDSKLFISTPYFAYKVSHNNTVHLHFSSSFELNKKQNLTNDNPKFIRKWDDKDVSIAKKHDLSLAETLEPKHYIDIYTAMLALVANS